MYDCEKCKYYHDNCDAKFRCRIDVEKIRADAIDEFKDRLLELCDCGIEQAECTGGNCYKCLDNQVDYSSIVDLAEELKEQKK